jgi:hypothetical protein
MRRLTVRSVGVLLVIAWGAQAARAAHTEFDYGVERVELDGNLHGPADGTVDLVDEFDDGVMGPLFGLLWGTAFEAGGALRLRNPGFHYEAAGQPFLLDQSEAMSGVLLDEGAGNLTTRVVWRPAPIGANHYIHASWYAFGADGVGAIGLALTNYDAELAGLFDPPQQPGLMMQAHAVRVIDPFTLESVVRDLRPVVYDSASGAIVMQLDYDDAARALTVSYSLDGGATYAPPFAPMPVVGFAGDGGGVGRLIVGADPHRVVSTPACQFVFEKVLFGGMGGALGDESVQIAGYGYAGTYLVDPSVEGLGVSIVDQGAGGAVLVDALGANKIPPGGLGTGCDPRDGWRQKGSRFTYRNYSDAFPPACAPGSARGVRSARVRPWKNLWGYIAVRVRLRNVAVAAVSGPIAGSRLTRGNGTGPPGGGCYSFVEYNAVSCAPTSASRVKCGY